MKIIVRGSAPEESVHRGTCYRCKSVIEFGRKEAKYTSDQREGDFLSVECPVCKYLIHVGVQSSIVAGG